MCNLYPPKENVHHFSAFCHKYYSTKSDKLQDLYFLWVYGTLLHATIIIGGLLK